MRLRGHHAISRRHFNRKFRQKRSEVIIGAVSEPVIEPCEESDDEDNTAHPQCPSHADVIAMCNHMTISRAKQILPNTAGVNSLQQLAINKQCNSKQQCH